MSWVSFLLDGGRPGWWCEQGDEAKAEVGADLWLLRRFRGHTTTQPSSIEEEGKSFQ
jgi:phage gp46-like protein